MRLSTTCSVATKLDQAGIASAGWCSRPIRQRQFCISSGLQPPANFSEVPRSIGNAMPVIPHPAGPTR